MVSLTDVSSASSALDTILLRRAFSWLTGKSGLPITQVMELPGMIRGTPIISGTGGMAEIIATGMPASSIIRLTVAPQRLQVPHEDVRITPVTSFSRSLAVISIANCSHRATGVRLPTVT